MTYEEFILWPAQSWVVLVQPGHLAYARCSTNWEMAGGFLEPRRLFSPCPKKHPSPVGLTRSLPTILLVKVQTALSRNAWPRNWFRIVKEGSTNLPPPEQVQDCSAISSHESPPPLTITQCPTLLHQQLGTLHTALVREDGCSTSTQCSDVMSLFMSERIHKNIISFIQNNIYFKRLELDVIHPVLDHVNSIPPCQHKTFLCTYWRAPFTVGFTTNILKHCPLVSFPFNLYSNYMSKYVHYPDSIWLQDKDDVMIQELDFRPERSRFKFPFIHESSCNYRTGPGIT